ncbi:MAG TPA: thiolase family protein [Terriglobales bacterium]|nr:thiolase family protein [Terriglobales bacterium]
MRGVWVQGVGITRFTKHVDRSARDLVEEAVASALRDAEIAARHVGAVYVGNALEGAITGQEAMRAPTVLRRTGLMGVPIFGVENADASGATVLHLAWQAVAYGIHDCAVAVGYEKFDHVDRAKTRRAANSCMDLGEVSEMFGAESSDQPSVVLRLSGAFSWGDGRRRFEAEPLAMVAVKNRRHGSLNACAHHQEPVTVEQVLQSRPFAGILTRLMVPSLSDGAACVVLCATDFPRGRRPVAAIAASVLRSGRGDDLGVWDPTRTLARRAYEMAGVGPEDVAVAEVHDLSSVGELYAYGELGFCHEDESERLVVDGVTWLGGRMPVNPSGGLIGRGHPFGATGIAQVVELAMQLEGRCGPRQVPGPRVGLAHNIGGWIGSDLGAEVIHVLKR